MPSNSASLPTPPAASIAESKASMRRSITLRVWNVNSFRVCEKSRAVNNGGMETFGQRLKRLREAQQMTQEQLAAACGYKQQSRIGNYESGLRTPSVKQIPVLAKGLGVPDQELTVVAPTLPARDQDSPELVELRLALGLTASILAESIPAAGDALAAALHRTFGSPRTGTFARDLLDSVKRAREGVGISRRSGNATAPRPRKHQ